MQIVASHYKPRNPNVDTFGKIGKEVKESFDSHAKQRKENQEKPHQKKQDWTSLSDLMVDAGSGFSMS